MREVIALRWYPGGAAAALAELVIHNVDTGEDYHVPRANDANAGWCIGIVALLDDDLSGEYFKVYIGPASGFSEAGDVEYIAQYGTPIADEVMARHLAPMCAAREYRSEGGTS